MRRVVSEQPTGLRRRVLVSLAAICCAGLAFSAACGSGKVSVDGPIPYDSAAGTGTMSANVDGANFSASGKTAVVTNHATSSSFSIVANGTGSTRLSLNAVGISSAGTYSMGAGGAAAGTWVSGASTWLSTLSGGSGTITFTTLTATRAVGTFSFTGAPVVGTSATGNKPVTNGTFDVNFTN
jgi:hypothetical protein